ncbi:hypothetical protein JD844_028658 [Phrynosoma platyrhinos]|uniref:Ovochymase-1 n=1 Tax=Phrynosoma platyrhinos TaxID=52577 RepID=A0ABQ7SIB9_PHRPL|nr:hypothetical protein JD844_028658 [Phrynosoma platyrhinos]
MLRISPRGMVKLTLSRLSVIKSDNCRTEFLAIYEENQRGRKILAKLCGILQSPLTFLSPGPVVKVEFHSTLHGSFSLAYLVLRHQGPKMKQQLTNCKDVILTAKEGIIHSPGFPNSYPHSTSCHWRIVALLNAIVRLDFLDFVIEKSHSKCHGGLTIYEGFGSAKEVLGNFCSESPRYPLKSRGPVVTLIFSSGVDTDMKGFVLAYGTHEIQLSPTQSKIREAGKGCPVLDLIPLGVAEIVSPNYPNTYPDSVICTWTVYSASGNKLKSMIRDLAMEDSKDCIWDSLSVYDGPDQHSELLGVPGKLMVSEERKCGIPLEESFLVEEVPGNTSVSEEVKNRMADGSQETLASWPWLVSLQFENQHFCGGILINENWVLTAGHCNVGAETDKVVLGVTHLLPGIKHGTQAIVKAVHIHTNFNEFSIRFQQTQILVLTNEACARYWGENIKNTNICGRVARSTSCVGDSGELLICKNDGYYKVVGVGSWGSGNCDPELPTVYTRISAYRSWISMVIKKIL